MSQKHNIKEKSSSELGYYFENLKRLRQKDIEAFDDYYIAFEKWAPFEAMASQFEKVESSLMKSLETLNKMDLQFAENIEDTVGEGTDKKEDSSLSSLLAMTETLGKSPFNKNTGLVNDDWVTELRDKCSNP